MGVGERVGRASDVLRGHIPPLLGLLSSLVICLTHLPGAARSCNFLSIDRFATGDILNELVHLCDPLIVFLEATYLTLEQTLLLVSEVEMLLEAFNVGAQRLVFISQFSVEVLLEVHVTTHVRNFSVPEVELSSLLLIVLLHKSDSTGHIFRPSLPFLEGSLQSFDTIIEGLLVCVKGCSQLLGSLTLLMSLHFLGL